MSNALLSAAVAVIAYILGAIDTPELCCRKFMGRSLRSYGRGQARYEAFWREEGPVGALKVVLPDVVKIVLAVLIGGWLLGIQDHALTGRALALFCLEMGRMYPINHRCLGTLGIKELLVGMFVISGPAGFLTLLVFAGVIWLTKYLSLAGLAAAAAAVLGTWLLARGPMTVALSALLLLMMLIRHSGHLRHILEHKEKKLTRRTDLSYKFDEDF